MRSRRKHERRLIEKGKGIWVGLVLLMGALALAADAEAQNDTQLYLRGGVWSPVSSVPFNTATAGELRFSQTVTLGLLGQRELASWLAVRGALDAGLTRPVALLNGEDCAEARAQGSVGADCRWSGAPRGWLVQGMADLVAGTGGFYGGVGVGPRLIVVPSFDCSLIDAGCVRTQEEVEQSNLRLGMRTVVGLRERWWGRDLTAEVGNVATRLEGRFHHELAIVLGVSVGGGSAENDR